MSKFFDSEQVQDTLEDIEELQKRVQDGMLSYGGGFIEFWQEDELKKDLQGYWAWALPAFKISDDYFK